MKRFINSRIKYKLVKKSYFNLEKLTNRRKRNYKFSFHCQLGESRNWWKTRIGEKGGDAHRWIWRLTSNCGHEFTHESTRVKELTRNVVAGHHCTAIYERVKALRAKSFILFSPSWVSVTYSKTLASYSFLLFTFELTNRDVFKTCSVISVTYKFHEKNWLLKSAWNLCSWCA